MDTAQAHAEDRARTLPLRQRLLDAYGPKDGQDEGPWFDADTVARELGGRVGTLLSKARELNDYHHIHLGLEFESRPLGCGRWEYRIIKRKPEQLPLSLREHHA